MFTHKQLTVLLSCVKYTLDQFQTSCGEINPTTLEDSICEYSLGNLCKKLEYIIYLEDDHRTLLIEELDKLLLDWEDFERNFPSDSDVANKRQAALQTLKNYILYH